MVVCISCVKPINFSQSIYIHVNIALSTNGLTVKPNHPFLLPNKLFYSIYSIDAMQCHSIIQSILFFMFYFYFVLFRGWAV